MTDQGLKLLDSMYDQMPLFRSVVEKELVKIVDRGRTLDKAVSFMAELLDGLVDLGSEERRYEVIERWLEIRLGWLGWEESDE